MQDRKSQNPVYSEAWLRKLLAVLNTIPGSALLTGANVKLFKADGFTPTPQNVLADFATHEATFTDYVQKAVAATLPVNLGANVEGAVQTVTWNMVTNPTTTSNSIGGYYVVDSASIIVCYESFASPVPMTVYTDALTLLLKLPMASFQSTGD
jgi:hypothetical protein